MKKLDLTIVSCILLYIFIPNYIVPVDAKLRLLILSVTWLYLFLNYYFHTKFGVINERWEKNGQSFSLKIFFQNNKYIFIILVLNILLHIWPIFSRTIKLRGDEPVLVQSALGIFTRIELYVQTIIDIRLYHLTQFIYLLCFILFILFFKRIINDLNPIMRRSIVGVFLVIFSYLYFIIIKDIPFHNALYRYPPMSKFLYLTSYTLFGINEFAPRLIQLALGSIGAIFFYRTVLLYYEKKIAILSVIILLFNPLYFNEINYAELGIGTISITIIIIFYFIRFLKDSADNDLLVTFMLIGIGFLYKRSILLLLISIPLYLLIFNFDYFKNNIKKIIKLICFGLIPILPFLIIGRFFSIPYLMDFSRLFSHTFDYFLLLQSQISPVIYFIFIISIPCVLLFYRNKMNIFIIYLSLSFYAFYTIYPWDNINRFSLAFIPIVAVYISVFFSKLIPQKIVFHILTSLLAIYLILISTIIQVPKVQEHLVVYKNFLNRHYPTDKAVQYIKENIPDGNVLDLHIGGFGFYRDKFNIRKNRMLTMTVKKFNEYEKQKIEEYLLTNNIVCIATTNNRKPYKKENVNFNIYASKKEFKYENGNMITFLLKGDNDN